MASASNSSVYSLQSCVYTTNAGKMSPQKLLNVLWRCKLGKSNMRPGTESRCIADGQGYVPSLLRPATIAKMLLTQRTISAGDKIVKPIAKMPALDPLSSPVVPTVQPPSRSLIANAGMAGCVGLFCI